MGEISSTSRSGSVNYKILITLNTLWYRMHIASKAGVEETWLAAKAVSCTAVLYTWSSIQKVS